MRNQWYGDNRDLVKWAEVFRLAQDGQRQVVYVPMPNPDDPPFDTLRLSSGAGLPQQVVQHFRDMGKVDQIPWPCGFVSVQGAMTDRAAYFRAVRTKVMERLGHPLVVVFDPDTGIEPKSGAGPTHVARDELREVFDLLRPKDVLVLYQHARRTNGWLAEISDDVAAALGVPLGLVRAVRCVELAWDVALLTVEKT